MDGHREAGTPGDTRTGSEGIDFRLREVLLDGDLHVPGSHVGALQTLLDLLHHVRFHFSLTHLEEALGPGVAGVETGRDHDVYAALFRHPLGRQGIHAQSRRAHVDHRRPALSFEIGQLCRHQLYVLHHDGVVTHDEAVLQHAQVLECDRVLDLHGRIRWEEVPEAPAKAMAVVQDVLVHRRESELFRCDRPQDRHDFRHSALLYFNSEFQSAGAVNSSIGSAHSSPGLGRKWRMHESSGCSDQRSIEYSKTLPKKP